MILLLGGTTEAKQVAGSLEQAGLSYIYSTRTEVNFDGKGRYRFGSLNKEDLEDFCIKEGVRLVIDACHPFAKELHQTVSSLSLNIPLIRFERQIPERVQHSLITYIEGYEDALRFINEKKYRSLLALSGVQSIPLLESFWRKNITWFRILERQYSKDFAANYGFPEQNLIYGLPQDSAAESALFTKLKPDVILTKESGLNGKLDAKVEAAIACGIPIIILKRPELPSAFTVVTDLEELKRSICNV